jgi:hypothetical protein
MTSLEEKLYPPTTSHRMQNDAMCTSRKSVQENDDAALLFLFPDIHLKA